MSGFSDYTAESTLSFVTGQFGKAAPTSMYLALFTTAPTSDAGTGGTEVSGSGYARVQVAGELAISGSTSTGSSAVTLSSTAPAWLLALGTSGSGVTVWSTAGVFIGTISTVSGTSVTLTGNAAAVASSNLLFSAFGQPSASSGSEPATTPANITNGAAITFPQATGSWGTVTSFGIYDASSSGNLYVWDYLGNFKWIPFTCTNASPGVLTCDTTGDAPANSSSIVVTSKYGGTLPSTGGSWAGLLTTANLSGATFTAGVNTTGIGGGQFRQVASQAIAANVTASFAASSLTITSA